MGRRRGSACALAAIVGVTVITGCSLRDGALTDEGSDTQSATPTHTPTFDDVRGPQPPELGAWLGAAVVPQKYTPQGRIDAYRNFQNVTGRQLDVAHTYHKWRDPFPNSVDEHFVDNGKQLLTGWAASDAPGIADGEYDDLIRQRAADVKSFGEPIMLALRWEMDRPNLLDQIGSPEQFVAAWQRTEKIFDDEGATNVGWVWAPTAQGFTDGYAQDFYPGDEHVDWIAVDAYTGMQVKPFADVMAAFMRFARKHEEKPVMIAEFGLSHRDGERPRWLAEARSYVRSNPEIKAVLYFNGNMNDGPTRQFALHHSPTGRKAFNAWLADPYFNTEEREVTEAK